VRHPFRKLSASVSHSLGSWLALVLLFVVLVPSLGLLWFLSRAAETEQFVVRQRLIAVYRAQLVSAQERFETEWARGAAALAVATDATEAAGTFSTVVTTGRADAVVCLDATGAVVYPTTLVAPAKSPTAAAWAEAERHEVANPAAAAAAFAQIAQSDDATTAGRALQAQARNLLRSGNRVAAHPILVRLLTDARFQGVLDAQGRDLAANAGLLALELAGDVAPDEAGALCERLRARVIDYDHGTMPATQRRFLLRELQRLAPEARTAALLDAEELAAAFVAAHARPVVEPGLRRTALPDVWQERTASGRIVLLHRHAALLPRLQGIIASPGVPSDVAVTFFPPEREPENTLLSLPAGPALPGWRIALTLSGPAALDASTTQQVNLYTWIVALLIVAAVALALLAGGLVRRQLALTRLRHDLVTNVTHELKTPLASMRLLVDTLLRAPRLEEQTTREYLQLIATENLRLSRLIGNFLTFSRLERNKYSFDFQSVAVEEIVHGAIAAAGDRLNAPGCRFDVAVAPDLPRVNADTGAMVTAVVNLLDNAWKYSAEPREIALTAATRDGAVALAVRDNGIGLAPRDRQRIFHRFVQVHGGQPANGSVVGVGLGLSIVQFIVSAHRGTIAVDSTPGSGSTFTITLPAANGTHA
jgi:signal transduction histidine kinase